MGEQRSLNNKGVPHVYRDEHPTDPWALTILYTAPRTETDSPYILHLYDLKNDTEYPYVVHRAQSTKLSLNSGVNNSVPPEIDAWALETAEVYDAILEGLGE